MSGEREGMILKWKYGWFCSGEENDGEDFCGRCKIRKNCRLEKSFHNVVLRKY